MCVGGKGNPTTNFLYRSIIGLWLKPAEEHPLHLSVTPSICNEHSRLHLRRLGRIKVLGARLGIPLLLSLLSFHRRRGLFDTMMLSRSWMNNDATVLQGRQKHSQPKVLAPSLQPSTVMQFILSVSSLMGVVWAHSLEMLELSLGQN